MKKILFTLLLLFPMSLYADSIFLSSSVSDSLVGYWTFNGNEVTNGVIVNRVNSTQNGNPENIATSSFYAYGKIGQSGNFDGTNDDVILPNSNTYNFDNTKNFTISGWINIAKAGSSETVFSTVNGSGTGGYGVYISTGNVLGFIVYNGVGSSAVLGNTVVTQKTWHHVAYVFTGPTTANLYLDGVLDKTGSFTQNLASISANRFIGTNSNLADHFNGKIDDLRIYNRALSDLEVRQLYNNGQNIILTPTSVTSQLSAYWKFDGKTIKNGVVQDQSGNAINGTLVNIASSTFYKAGRIGQALNFDGVNDRMNFSVAPSTTTFSMSAWVFPTSHVANYGEVMTQNTTRGLYIKSDQHLTYFDGTDRQCPTTIPDRQWNHVLVVAQGTFMTFWVNGIFCSAVPFTVAAPTFTNMGSSNTASEQFGGLIDDARIYNTALSTSTILQIYNTGWSVMKKTSSTTIDK